jgi:hypothetical protein
MNWTKALLGFTCGVLLPGIIINFLLGHGSEGFYELFKYQFVIILQSSLIVILPILVFSSELDKEKKIRWLWYSTGIVLATLVFVSMVRAGGGDNGWAILGIIIFSIVYVVGMTIFNLILTFLLSYEENKQIKILLSVFLVEIAINILQLFGFFRFALIE